MSDASQFEEPAPTLFAPPRAFATQGLIAVFVVVYLCELIFAVDKNSNFEPSVRTLAYLGGDIALRVKGAGEYWRMFTAPLMHASLLHILMNSFVLLLAGTLLERMLGWKWLLGLFAITALGGETASLVFGPQNIVGVGASGGVMGILAALFGVSGRLAAPQASAMRTRAMQFLIPSLVPIFYAAGGNVNYFAHAGGAVVGLGLGYALLKLWPQTKANPPLANFMAFAALSFFAVAVYAIYPIVKLRGL